MRKQQSNNLATIIKENLWIISLVSICILFISLMVAYYVGNDFHGDALIKTGTFIGVFVIGETLFLLIFLKIPNYIVDIWDKLLGRKKEEIIETKEADNAPLQVAEEPDNAPAQITTEPSDIPVQAIEQSQIEIPEAIESVSGEMTTEDYELIQKAHEQEEANEWIRFENAVVRYTMYTLSSYLAQNDIPLFCVEIKEWMRDPEYKAKHTFKPIKKIHNIDFRHYIWSIWTRLGTQDGRSGKNAGLFIMSLLPEIFKDKNNKKLDGDTVKNLTAPVKNEKIPCDEKDPNDRCYFSTVPDSFMITQS